MILEDDQLDRPQWRRFGVVPRVSRVAGRASTTREVIEASNSRRPMPLLVGIETFGS